MGIKRTTQQPAIPEGAIVIKVDLVDIDTEAAEAALEKMKAHVGLAQFDLAMDHLYQLFTWDAVTNPESQLNGILCQSMQKLRARTLDHLHQSHECIEQLEAEQQTMRTEQNDLKAKLAELSGRVRVLESALCSVRKCLKSPEVKVAVSYCQRLRKGRPSGETAEAALALADGVKDACVCIREL